MNWVDRIIEVVVTPEAEIRQDVNQACSVVRTKASNIRGLEDLQDITENTTDGFHTFKELYDHRITLFIALCKNFSKYNCTYCEDVFGPKCHTVWRSKHHSDGSEMEGWYILGTGKEKGKQITYHLPLERWDETDFAETLDKAPEWDGHCPQDVLKRLKSL